jgi:hypothetical protein
LCVMDAVLAFTAHVSPRASPNGHRLTQASQYDFADVAGATLVALGNPVRPAFHDLEVLADAEPLSPVAACT